MYQIEKNSFIDTGRCSYVDEYGNHAYFIRLEDGFNAKLALHDKNIRAETVKIRYPLTGEGFRLVLNKSCSAQDVTDGINGFITLLHHWMSMINDINFYLTKNECLKVTRPATDTEIWEEKVSRIEKYPELSQVRDFMKTNSR